MDLLDVMLQVENRHKTAVELSELAGISLITYYRALYKAQFREYYNTLLKSNWTPKAQAMIQTVFDMGMKNEKNFTDRKLFLELVGVSQDKKTIDINKKSMSVDVNLTKLTTEEIRQMVKQMVKDDPKLIESMQGEDEEEPTDDEIIESEIINE